MSRDFTLEIARLRQCAVDFHRQGRDWQSYRSMFGGRLAFLEQELGGQNPSGALAAITIIADLQSLVANGPAKEDPPFPVTSRAEHVD